MWAVMVEVGAPRYDQMRGMSEAIEQMFVEAFVRCPAGDCEAIWTCHVLVPPQLLV